MYALCHQLSIAHTLIALFLAVNNPIFSGFPMADWFERLFKCFIEFRECYNWVCRYHNGVHYQDEIVVEGVRALWKLHGGVIAVLEKPQFGSMYILSLMDAGYPTLTTISRLNGILWYFERMGIENGVRFKLKYSKGFGVGCYPTHTYVTVNGRAFRVSLVKIAIDMESKKTSIFLDENSEVTYVRDDKKLEKIRRAYRQIDRLIDTTRDTINNLYQRDRYKAEEYEVRLAEISKAIDKAKSGIVEEGGVMYGVYVKKMEDALKLIDLAKELRKLYREAKEALAYTMLTQ